jgi:hypothetical protein
MQLKINYYYITKKLNQRKEMTKTIAIIAQRVYRWFKVQSQVTEGRVPVPSLNDSEKCSKGLIMSLDALSEHKSGFSTPKPESTLHKAVAVHDLPKAEKEIRSSMTKDIDFNGLSKEVTTFVPTVMRILNLSVNMSDEIKHLYLCTFLSKLAAIWFDDFTEKKQL